MKTVNSTRPKLTEGSAFEDSHFNKLDTHKKKGMLMVTTIAIVRLADDELNISTNNRVIFV